MWTINCGSAQLGAFAPHGRQATRTRFSQQIVRFHLRNFRGISMSSRNSICAIRIDHTTIERAEHIYGPYIVPATYEIMSVFEHRLTSIYRSRVQPLVSSSLYPKISKALKKFIVVDEQLELLDFATFAALMGRIYNRHTDYTLSEADASECFQSMREVYLDSLGEYIQQLESIEGADSKELALVKETASLDNIDKALDEWYSMYMLKIYMEEVYEPTCYSGAIEETDKLESYYLLFRKRVQDGQTQFPLLSSFAMISYPRFLDEAKLKSVITS